MTDLSAEVRARVRCSDAAIALSKMAPDAPAETVRALTGEMRDALDAYRTAILDEQAALVAQLTEALRRLKAEARLCLRDGISAAWLIDQCNDALAAAEAQKSADGA